MAPAVSSPLSSRDSSPELGDSTVILQYNKRTGRPVRRSAGQKKVSVAGYVDSKIIEEEDDSPIEMPLEDEDGDIVKPVRTKRRKRSPSPTPPPFDPTIYNDEPDEQSDGEDVGMFRRNATDTPIVLQLNVPLGYHGPLMVKLDKSLLDKPEGRVHNMRPRKTRRIASTSVSDSGKAVSKKENKSFTELPPEIRNNVYRHLFVADRDLIFHSPNNFKRSAQFLQTCRTVFSEGCSILYGENKFVFDRNRTTRAPFWDPQPKEIGYKDCRQFLKMIGPENLAYIRDIRITFEDASPAATPYLPTHESRRYINDKYLVDVLRILRETKLRSLAINFHGRRMLLKSDIKFLGYLEQIKADEVITSDNVRWYQTNKVHPGVFDDLKEVMVRRKKLYVEKK
jgi:hypothetical protein